MKKNVILKGTLILTLAGIFSRFLGFYYRIFLTQTIGSEGLGLYQMVFPLISVCMAISCSGIALAISRYTALFVSQRKNTDARHILITGTLMSVFISIICTLILYFNAEFIATKVLLEKRCTMLVKLIALTLPLSVIHNCINSHYIGKNNTIIPAASQFIEQLIRIGSVILIYKIQSEKGIQITAATGIAGILCGEIISCIFCLTTCSFTSKDFKIPNAPLLAKDIFIMAFPVSTNRITLSLLHSMEAVLIPAMLKLYGLTASESLSTYGIVSGMAFPLVMLPSTLINSFSTMLLPAVSSASNKENAITRTIHTAYECSLLIGIFCLGAFMVWGDEAGYLLFSEYQVGMYVNAFAWMCPFLYISTTFSSILNGLGKTSTTLFIDTSAFLIRIALIVTLIPYMGITGFLIAFLTSEVYLALASIIVLHRLYPVSFDSFKLIIKPAFSLIIASGVSMYFNEMLIKKLPSLNHLLLLLSSGIVMTLVYFFFVLIGLKEKPHSSQ